MKSLENKGKKMTGTFNRSDLQGEILISVRNNLLID